MKLGRIWLYYAREARSGPYTPHRYMLGYGLFLLFFREFLLPSNPAILD